MNLWDYLCTILRARVVSTEDVSSKVRALPQFPTPCTFQGSGHLVGPFERVLLEVLEASRRVQKQDVDKAGLSPVSAS